MARMIRTLLAPAFAVLMVVSGTATQAAFSVGTQGMADVGSPSIDGTAGATLATATTFTFGSLVTTTAETGSFLNSGSNGLTLTTTTINLATPTSFSVGSAAFGTFTGATITQLFSSPQVRSFFILGTFVSGTNFGSPVTSVPASFTVSFTQTGGAGSAISDSSTLSIPPAIVPEPASIAMLGLGLAGSIGFAARRRLARA